MFACELIFNSRIYVFIDVRMAQWGYYFIASGRAIYFAVPTVFLFISDRWNSIPIISWNIFRFGHYILTLHNTF